MCFAAFAVLFCAVMYCLYRRGLVLTKSVRAILFFFRPRKDGDAASLDSCTGWVQRVGRFPESRAYEFVLSAQLSKGEAAFCLLDGSKRTLLRLDRRRPSGEAELRAGGRYYLRWEFKNATGNCRLRWLPSRQEPD